MYLPAGWAHLTLNEGEAVAVGAQQSWQTHDREVREMLDMAKMRDPEAAMWFGSLYDPSEALRKAAHWHPLAVREKLALAVVLSGIAALEGEGDGVVEECLGVQGGSGELDKKRAAAEELVTLLGDLNRELWSLHLDATNTAEGLEGGEGEIVTVSKSLLRAVRVETELLLTSGGCAVRQARARLGWKSKEALLGDLLPVA